jgi:acetoin utilization protein AcuB
MITEVSEIMERKVFSLPPGAPLIEAAELMHDHNIRHIPVVDHNEIVGVLSDRDLRGYLEEVYRSSVETPTGFRRKNLTVREVMHSKPLTIDPGTTVSEAIDLMLENKIGALVVADTLNQLKGIVSYEDILRSVRDDYEARV